LTELFEDLRDRKVNLVSLRDGLDLSTPSGRLMADALASVTAYETEVRTERIVAGQAVARERGARFGRPVGTGKRIKVTPEQEETICRFGAEDRRHRPRHGPLPPDGLLRPGPSRELSGAERRAGGARAVKETKEILPYASYSKKTRPAGGLW